MGAAVTPRPLQLGGNLIGRMKRLILGARVGRLALEHSAGVLPNLTAIVPMETKLGKLGGDLLWLLAFKGNPNPLADNLGNFKRGTQTALQQIQNLFGGQLAIQLPLCKVDAQDSTRLCCRC